MTKKEIDIRKEVNPHFAEVWKAAKPFNVLKGGRNSFKSSVIALLLVSLLIPYLSRGEKANVVVIRKVGNTIRDSVFNKIQWALKKFFLINKFDTTVSPFKITHKKTGSTFYFYGQDDFHKLKSNDINDIIAVWYEEAAEFKDAEEFDQTNTTFMRQKQKRAAFVRFFWSYNPPRNPYSWINEWADQQRSNSTYLVHESSYLNDELGFVNDQMLDVINRIKENDYDYYRYLYLGEAVGLGTNVYNMNLFQSLKTIPSDDRIIMIDFAIDTGHQVSATTCLALGFTAKENVILLDTYYYSPANQVVKKAPSDYSKELREFMTKIVAKYNAPVDMQTVDSAEGGLRNQYYKDYGVSLHPVAKGKKVDMIDFVCDLLAQGHFYYLDIPENQIFIEEHRKYQWDVKTVNTDKPEVVKEDDHTCDAFQYYVKDNLRKLGLKF
ncbi:PBSX family phage terminase large subunit [Listeria monocytogenes]|uniref:PBSX family phage terminase large subunit n=1 Tax=Listeria monocytogenes TaxID=1639 RepID=UPI000C86B23B|nr:PBSX family phage terminase large subunit [Listeria monocytogenes]PMR03856.1 PBSX family phage terminase large subunit [Listeria monocytogenes]PMR24862.1 PBSX family phage terminase large subunit [Listeria monocytogenes]